MTIEKHEQCSCGSHGVTSIDVECVYVDQSCSRRLVSPSLYEAISRALCPMNRYPILQSLLLETLPHLAPSPSSLECTCQKIDTTEYDNQFQYATQIAVQCNSPQSNNSISQYESVDNVNITQFFNDVKRILKSNLPSKMRLEDHKQGLKKTFKRDSYSCARSVSKSEFPFQDLVSSNIETNHNQIDQQQEYSSTDLLSIVTSTLKPNFYSTLSSGRTIHQKQDHSQEFSTPRNHISSSKRLIGCNTKMSSSLKTTMEQTLENDLCIKTIEWGTSHIVYNSIMV